MDLYTFANEINAQVEEMIADNATAVPAEQLRLDRRCGTLYVSDHWIAKKASEAGSLNYYGGFEYINKEYVTTIGNYVFYSVDDDTSRVQNHIDYYMETNEHA